MSDAWKVFSKAELQAFIGEDTLSRLARVLPALDSAIDQDSVYLKSTLSAIFDSFVGTDALNDRQFRYDLLNHQAPSTVNALVRALNLAPETLSFEEKISKLASKSWRDDGFCRAFLTAIGLPDSLAPSQAAAISSVQLLEGADFPFKQLKDYQFGVFAEASRRLSVANSRFVIQMPTGSGKTRTAMEIVSSFLNDSSPHGVVVWLAHSEELCDQAYEAFLEVWRHVGRHPVRLVRCWGAGARLPIDFEERGLIIGGFQKLHGLLSANTVPFDEIRRRTTLVVIDEAHKVLAPTYRQVTRSLIGDGTRVVGLTATPGRSAVDADQNRALAEFFFNEIVTIETDGRSVIQLLRQRSVLSDVSYEPIYSQLHYELSDSERRYLESFFDLPTGVLKAIGSDDVRNIEILKRLQKECADGRQTIFFACSLEHSKFITATLSFLGIKAAHVDGQTSRARRREIIDGFKAGRIQVICNFGVLSTGFDAPKIDLVFISRPTASIVLYSQMIGRGLRGPAIGGTRECKVIDVKDNIIGFSNQETVYDYFAEYFQSEP